MQQEIKEKSIVRRANSVMKIGGRKRLGYGSNKTFIERNNIGVPVFLTKANSIWKDTPNYKVESTMTSAIKRYESSLEQAGRAAIISKYDAKERAQNLNELMDLETTKRKLNERRIQKYLELQIKENVSIKLTNRNLKHKLRNKKL